MSRSAVDIQIEFLNFILESVNSCSILVKFTLLIYNMALLLNMSDD